MSVSPRRLGLCRVMEPLLRRCSLWRLVAPSFAVPAVPEPAYMWERASRPRASVLGVYVVKAFHWRARLGQWQVGRRLRGRSLKAVATSSVDSHSGR